MIKENHDQIEEIATTFNKTKTKDDLILYIELCEHLKSTVAYSKMENIGFEWESGGPRDYNVRNMDGVIISIKANKFFGCVIKVVSWGVYGN